jgi:hypothetical protein
VYTCVKYLQSGEEYEIAHSPRMQAVIVNQYDYAQGVIDDWIIHNRKIAPD